MIVRVPAADVRGCILDAPLHSAFKLNAAGTADAIRCFVTSCLHHSVVACNNYYLDLRSLCGFRTCCLARISFGRKSARER